MKLVDKLKNIFFEEVEEEEDTIELPKTFAKKVEVPKKQEKRAFEEDDDDDDDYEEKVVEKPKVTRPVIEDKVSNLTQEIPVQKEEEKEEISSKIPMMFDDDDFYEDVKEEPEEYKKEEKIEYETPKYKYEPLEYNDSKVYTKSYDYDDTPTNNNNYAYTKTTYKKEEVKIFKPTPIISPVYGILDKNYRKEEVVAKRETRISTTYKPNIDSVRNKAFASIDEDKEVTKPKSLGITPKKEKKIYDVNSTKPRVSKVTLADADEYYNDLGLAYNEDYSDASRITRSSKYNVKEKKNEKKNVDENLFDLIDSMYSKED